MRILFCAWRDTAHPRAGGSEVLVDRIATGLHARGHDVTVLCAGPVESHPYAVVANGGRLTQFLRAPFMARRLPARPDLIVDVANGTGFYPALWSRTPRLSLVNHLHTEQWDDWFPRPVAAVGRWLETHLLPWANRNNVVAAVSASTATALRGIGVDPGHLAIVHNGVDAVEADATAPIDGSTDGPLFLAVGRLVPHKRYDLLLDMWDDVRPVTGGRLVVIGEGPEMPRLARGLDPSVVLAGPVDDETRDRLYERACLLLHPARVEGWGLVVSEAAARSTPAIAFDAPGVRDSIVDGVTGRLAEDRAAFVAHWRELGTDAAERSALGDAARRRSRDFSWDRTVDEFERLAQRAVTDGPSDPVGRPGTAPIPAYEGWRPALTDRAMARLSHRLDRHELPPLSRRNILRLFLREKHDPEPFYRALAARTVASLPHQVDGARILDLGCGPGTYATELRRAGAHVIAVDRSVAPGGRDDDPGPQLLADAGRLPLPTGRFDGVFCSNLLEHTPDVQPVFAEIARVLVPGGWAWVSFTNWYSPWGGHEITPLHLLGPRLGLATHRRLFGEPRKNVPYEELWPTHIGPTIRAAERSEGLRLTSVVPRYYPGQRWIMGVPGLREIAAWNCLLHLERQPP